MLICLPVCECMQYSVYTESNIETMMMVTSVWRESCSLGNRKLTIFRGGGGEKRRNGGGLKLLMGTSALVSKEQKEECRRKK